MYCVFTIMQMIKWFSRVDCQTALQIMEMVQESSRKITVALFYLKLHLSHTLPPSSTKRSRKGCGIIAMMLVLSKINLLNETDSLLSSQKPND